MDEGVWALISKADDKERLHRLTFSKSLALLSQKQALDRWGLECELRRARFKTGQRLEKGQTSASGAYAIVSAKSGVTLRISLIKELAWLAEDQSREIRECWLLPQSQAD